MINLIKRMGKLTVPVGILITTPLIASVSTNLRADDFVGIWIPRRSWLP